MTIQHVVYYYAACQMLTLVFNESYTVSHKTLYFLGCLEICVDS